MKRRTLRQRGYRLFGPTLGGMIYVKIAGYRRRGGKPP